MKRYTALLALLLTVWFPLSAANTVKKVSQVTEAVELTDDVDYHITGTTPFTTTGSINLVNTDHAVIIFDELRPSAAKKQLGYIKINGAKAVADQNCQIRLHGHGAILYPYRKEAVGASGFHPLVVYSEKNCQGTSCESFALESSGGFMTTLTTAKLNNRIRSFTLKRGYMVTFSLKAEGRGYSRCFIAADEDLVMNSLPALMDQRISSYRVFRWIDPGKMGVADMLDTGNLGKLNATWSYTWGNGHDLGTDYECVPHMNHRWGPSAADMGAASYSCHIKTDNEPGNSADPEPATVDEVLGRWENCMRTGKRLMTPSSHDGSMNWFSAFLDSIDARGWRCEILDFHCYWTEGQYGNLKGYADRYGRPIWITEYVWGASWNNNGAFASGVTETQNRDVMNRIWNNLNNWNWVERHAYWNGERDPSRILKSGSLTPAGQVYAKMNSGLGYSNYGNYIPKAPPYKVPVIQSVTNDQKKGTNTVKWSNPSGELTDSTVLQRRLNTSTTWENVAAYGSVDKDNFEYTDTIHGPGLYSYRLMAFAYNAPTKKLYSGIASVTLGSANVAGDLMYGRLLIGSGDASVTTFPEQETSPFVILGMPSNANTNVGLTSQVLTAGKDSFKFTYRPWPTAGSTDISKVETSDYIVAQPGNYTWGDMKAEVGTYHKADVDQSMMGDTEVEVLFNQPFDEGVVPVVIAQNQSTVVNAATVTVQIRDVTNRGFKAKLQAQNNNTLNVRTMYLRYIAVTPGEAPLSEMLKISAGIGAEPVGGTTNREVYFTIGADTLQLFDPYILANSQTHNLDYAMVMRKYSNISVADEAAADGVDCLTGIKVRRQMDASVTFDTKTQNRYNIDGDYIGWIVISTLPGAVGLHNVDAIHRLNVQVLGRTICPTNPSARIYTVNGRQVPARTSVPPGIYVVTDGRQTTKVVVR